MLSQILVWLLVAGLGWVIIFYSNGLVDAFGRIPWAESNLSGTRNAYVLFGFGAIVVGFLIVFGVIPLKSSVM